MAQNSYVSRQMAMAARSKYMSRKTAMDLNSYVSRKPTMDKTSNVSRKTPMAHNRYVSRKTAMDQNRNVSRKTLMAKWITWPGFKRSWPCQCQCQCALYAGIDIAKCIRCKPNYFFVATNAGNLQRRIFWTLWFSCERRRSQSRDGICAQISQTHYIIEMSRRQVSSRLLHTRTIMIHVI